MFRQYRFWWFYFFNPRRILPRFQYFFKITQIYLTVIISSCLLQRRGRRCYSKKKQVCRLLQLGAVLRSDKKLERLKPFHIDPIASVGHGNLHPRLLNHSVQKEGEELPLKISIMDCGWRFTFSFQECRRWKISVMPKWKDRTKSHMKDNSIFLQTIIACMVGYYWLVYIHLELFPLLDNSTFMGLQAMYETKSDSLSTLSSTVENMNRWE